MVKSNLDRARVVKNDEFYTRLEDVENELQYYTEHFKGKVVYLNADDPKLSNFWRYFKDNFEQLQLKELISTYFVYDDSVAYVTRLTEDGEERQQLKGNGDFRNDECVELLKESDIIITNPPFSLFRALIDLLVEHKKDFILIGNQNAITYKNVFPLLKDKKVKLGVNGRIKLFIVPPQNTNKHTFVGEDGITYQKFGNVLWFTTLEHGQVPPSIKLTKTYNGNEDEYPNYDNYDAINIDRVKAIPADYDGAMGVPITFLIKWNSEQFDVLGIADRQDTYGLRTKKYTKKDHSRYSDLNANGVIIDGGEYKSKYSRIIIKNKNPRTFGGD